MVKLEGDTRSPPLLYTVSDEQRREPDLGRAENAEIPVEGDLVQPGLPFPSPGGDFLP